MGMRNQELLDEIRQLVQPWLDELRRTITSSNTTNERGAHRVSVVAPPAAPGQGVKASTVANELKGYSFRETTGVFGATAVVVLRDGTDNTGDVVVPITLGANESVRDWFSERGIALLNGLFVDRVSGSVEGAVYLRGSGAT